MHSKLLILTNYHVVENTKEIVVSFIDETNVNATIKGFAERKDIAVVIKDKHKLLGLEISKENFTESNLPDFAKQTQIIDYYNDIAKSEITVDDIQFVLNARTIIK